MLHFHTCTSKDLAGIRRFLFYGTVFSSSLVTGWIGIMHLLFFGCLLYLRNSIVLLASLWYVVHDCFKDLLLLTRKEVGLLTGILIVTLSLVHYPLCHFRKIIILPYELHTIYHLETGHQIKSTCILTITIKYINCSPSHSIGTTYVLILHGIFLIYISFIT